MADRAKQSEENGERFGCRSPDEQCQMATMNGSDGMTYCALRASHRGPHVNNYVLHVKWITREEGNRRIEAALPFIYPPRRKRARKGGRHG